jgi:hypothetical protein
MEETVHTYTILIAPHKPAYHYITYRPCKIYYCLHYITLHTMCVRYHLLLKFTDTYGHAKTNV